MTGGLQNEPINVHRKKVKWFHYRSGVAQRVGRGIALLFHDRGSRRGWVIGSMPRPHFTPGKDPVPILQGAGWAPGPVWTGGKTRPHRDSIPDRPAELPGPNVHSTTPKPPPPRNTNWPHRVTPRCTNSSRLKKSI